MIVTLNGCPGLHIVDVMVKFFEEKSCDVLIRNGKSNLVLFVGGAGVGNIDLAKVREIPHVKRVTHQNRLLVGEHSSFVEAWQYIAKREVGAKLQQK